MGPDSSTVRRLVGPDSSTVGTRQQHCGDQTAALWGPDSSTVRRNLHTHTEYGLHYETMHYLSKITTITDQHILIVYTVVTYYKSINN